MGLLDRLFNPAWHKILSLDVQGQAEMSALVCIQGYIRKGVDDELVTPFEKLCGVTKDKALIKGGHRVVPFLKDQRPRLVDEAQIGWLTCMRGRPFLTGYLRLINPDEAIDGIGCIALAEINSRRGIKGPETLEKTGYSQEMDECKIQIIIHWMKILGIDDPDAAALISSLIFETQWKAMESFSSGVSTGLGRTPKDQLFKRAAAECEVLSPGGRAIVKYLVAGLAMKIETEGVGRQKDKEGKIEQREDVLLFQEVLERTDQLMKVIMDKSFFSRRDLVITVQGSVEKANQLRNDMELLNREHTLGLMLGLIGMRRSNGREGYVVGNEYRNLRDHVTQEISRFIEVILDHQGYPVGDERRKQNMDRSIAMLTDDLRTIQQAIVTHCYQRQKGFSTHPASLLTWYEERTGVSGLIARELERSVAQALAGLE